MPAPVALSGTFCIGIYLFNDVEVLDFAGPYEVFTTASRMHARDHPGTELFRVYNVSDASVGSMEPSRLTQGLKQGLTQGLTQGRTQDRTSSRRARAGLSVLTDVDFTNCPSLDVLIVPGGVVDAEMAKPDVIDWIRNTDAHTAITASICTGAFLLAQAGLLTGKRATTHWEDIGDLGVRFPTLTVVENMRWVDEGHIVTSAGISAGMDMSLHLVERLAGRALALRTARQMEFDWTDNPRQD